MNWVSKYLANATVLRYFCVALMTIFVCFCHRITLTEGKVFERCELAQALRYGHGVEVKDVGNWVCVAQHSSSFNTSAYGGNEKSGSHGIFQISDEYWCSPPGKGLACGVACDRLRDDDISDDFECVKIIYDEQQRLTGNGFNAWTAYEAFCKDNPYEYIEECFGKEEQEYLHSKSTTANYDETDIERNNNQLTRGKVYARCELARELFDKHSIPMDEIPTWLCIAHRESNYNTSLIGRLNTDGSHDYGLFQISDIFWCSQKGGRKGECEVPCSKLLDSDITEDVKCVKQIHKKHTKISGDGFNAWAVYKPYCQGTVSEYIQGCFNEIGSENSKSVEEQKTKPLDSYRGLMQPRKGGTGKEHDKVYQPCELAEELRNKYHMPEDQIATWVCIAKHESRHNTSDINHDDHGLFQISDIYWCSPPDKGWACGLSCTDFEDNDIGDDVSCIKKIFEEQSRISGDGFNAWTVYPRYCSNGRSDKYISHCSSSDESQPVVFSQNLYSSPVNLNSVEDFQPAKGKIYERCELANELLAKHRMPMEEIPTWVCIANHESSYDTSAVGRLNADGSADHGLFQISDLYWCSDEDGHGKACGLPCSKLLDSDISDDVKCIKQIHEEHTKISGDGFDAWAVYNTSCKDSVDRFISGCFDGSVSIEPIKGTTKRLNLSKNKPKGKVYEECELATELRDKHHIPNDQIPSWVCIAKHQSGLNTATSVAGSHGIFFISEEFWCGDNGNACDLHCSDLEDSDISDDVECVRKIYDEHQRIFGNGFNAWNVYVEHCSNGRANDYLNDCVDFKSTKTNATALFTQDYQFPSGGRAIDLSKPVSYQAIRGNPFFKFDDPQIYVINVGKVVNVNNFYSNNPYDGDGSQQQLNSPSTFKSFDTSSVPLWLTPTTMKPTYPLEIGPWNAQMGKIEPITSFWLTKMKPSQLPSTTSLSWKSSVTHKSPSTTSSTTTTWLSSTTPKPLNWSQFGQWSTHKSNTVPTTAPSWQIYTNIPFSSSSNMQSISSTTSVPLLQNFTSKKLTPKAPENTYIELASSNQKPPNTNSVPSWFTSTTKRSTTRLLTPITLFSLDLTTKPPSTTTARYQQHYQSGNHNSFSAPNSPTKSSMNSKASATPETVQLKDSTTKTRKRDSGQYNSGQYNSGQYNSGKYESKILKSTSKPAPQPDRYNDVVTSKTTKTPATRSLSIWETTTTQTPLPWYS